MLNSEKHELDMMLRTILLSELCKQTGLKPVSPQEIMSKIRQTVDAMPDKNNKRRKARLFEQIDSLEIILSMYVKSDNGGEAAESQTTLLERLGRVDRSNNYIIPIEINGM